jgi:hypothetical protein
MDNLLEIPFLEILKLGLIGLGFLLSLFTFLLLRNEQNRDGAVRKNMITAIYVFMIFSFIFFVINTGFEIWNKMNTASKLAKNNEDLILEKEKLENQLAIFNESWTINGSFSIDYHAGGKDMKFYTIPPTEITTFVVSEGVTGFSLSNFKATVVNEDRFFPNIGFTSEKYDSKGAYEINRDYDTFDDKMLFIKLNNPIQFMRKPD